MIVVEKSPEFANIFRWNAGLTLLRRDSAAAALLEDRQFFIDDPLLLEIMVLLTAPHREDDLYAKLCPRYAPEAISFALEDLCRNRLITTSASQLTSRNAAAFWDTISCAGPKTPIQVVSLIPRFGPAIETMLKANGVAVEPEAERLLLVTGDYLDPEVKRVCAGRTLLPVRPAGAELWIGPLLGPAGPVCWECLSYWLKLRRWPEYAVTGMNHRARQAVNSIVGLPSWMTSTCGLIATAATLWSADSETPFLAQLCIWSASGFSWSRHVATARANCPVCPKPSREQQFAQMRDSRTGLLQKLRTSPDKIGSVHLAHATALLPLGIDRAPLPPFSADGHGASGTEAVERCTAEAIERYSSVYVGDEALIRSTIREVDGIAPNDVLLLSQRQYLSRGTFNQSSAARYLIPEPFDSDSKTAWVKARRLTGTGERFLPAALVYLGYPFRGEPVFALPDTNGCAAADTLPHALLNAILELIERDAMAVWWYNRLHRPGLDGEAFIDLELSAAKETLKAQGRTLEILDITHDLRIPCAVAVTTDDSGRDVVLGSAAATSWLAAAKKAVRELLQMWYWGRELARSTTDQRHRRLSLEQHPFLTPLERIGVNSEAVTPSIEHATSSCLEALRGAGLEAFVVELTRPELAYPAVRVVVPGLRPVVPNFALGRLYRVPTRAGWTDRELLEEQMNPEPCPL